MHRSHPIQYQQVFTYHCCRIQNGIFWKESSLGKVGRRRLSNTKPVLPHISVSTGGNGKKNPVWDYTGKREDERFPVVIRELYYW